MKEELFSQISAILAEWDPIGVPKWLSEDEYREYVLPFINMPKDYDRIKKEVLHILVDKIGFCYSEENPIDKSYVDEVVKKIYNVLY